MQSDPPDLSAKISQLEAMLWEFERRLHRLELASSPGPEIETVEHPARPEGPSTGPSIKTPTLPPGEPPPLRMPDASTTSTRTFGRRAWKPPRTPFLTAELEALIGTSWLNRLGVLAIIAAVAYFLKYAFDNNWIGPTGRIGLTLLGGALLLAAGEWYQRKHLSIFAQGLSGGGVAVLYLAIFSAFAIYRLIGVVPAFATTVLITVAAMALALRYDSIAIAALGLLGGFATPFLLGGPTGATPGGVPTPVNAGVYLYFLLLDAGAYELARRRRWWRFGSVGLVAGFLAPVVLAAAALPDPSAAAVYYVLLTLATLLLSAGFAMKELAGAALVGAFVCGPMAGILLPHEPVVLGYFAVITVAAIAVAERHDWARVATVSAVAGGVFPGLAYAFEASVLTFLYLLLIAGTAAVAAARRGWPTLALLAMLATGASATLISIGEANRFMLAGWVTTLFLVFSVTAAWAGRERTELWMQTALLAAFVYMGQLYLIFGSNRDVLALFAAGLAAYHLGVTRVLLGRGRPVLEVLVYLGLATTFVTIAIPLKLHQSAVPLAWSAEGVVLAWAAVRARNIWAARAAALIGGLVAARLVLIETAAVVEGTRFVVSTPGFVFAFGILALGLTAYLLRRLQWPSEWERIIPGALGGVAAGLLLWWIGWEINGLADRVPPTSWFSSARHVALSTWLALFGFGLVVVGFRRNLSEVRWAGIGLLGITVAKVIVVDLAEVQVVYRMLSLFVLGALLLLASLVYGRYQQRLGGGSRR